MRTIFLGICLSIFIPKFLYSQINCSVNAGANANYCIGIDQRFEFFGGVSGSFDLNTIQWSIIDQPQGSNLLIENPNSLITQSSPFSVAGNYIFRLSLECEFGSTFQDVSYYLSEEPVGELVFPDLDCIDISTLIEVKKKISPDFYFQYSFINQGILQIHSETDSTLILQHGIGRCFDVQVAEISYGVANDDGCVISKTASFKVPFYYERGPLQISQRGNGCLSLNADCTVGGDVRWRITEAPPGSNAYFENETSNPGILCDIIDGCYTISFELSGTACNDTIQYFRFCDKSDFGIFRERRDSAYCEFPKLLALTVESDDLPHICTDWRQVDGPPGLEITQINNGLVLVEGLISGQYYVIQFEEINKLNNCRRIIEFHISETPSDLEDELELTNFWRQCFGGCSTFLRLEAGLETYLTDIGVSDVNVFISLTNWPSDFDFEEGVRLTYSYGGICDFQSGNIDLNFNDQQQTNELTFDFLPLSKSCGLTFELCDARASGSYSFSVQFISDCFNESYDIDLFYFQNISFNAINAGTDQILPCGQDTTSLVGSLAMQSSASYPGFWQFVEIPSGAVNPIQGSINTRVLKLENLIPGLYRFVYNSGLVGAFASCNSSISSDTVQVLVSDGEALAFEEIEDQEFCLLEEIIINVPFSGASANITQLTGPQVDFELVNNKLQWINPGVAGDYSFEYLLISDCEEYRDTFDISIFDTTLEPAIIFTQDSCHRFSDSIITVELVAQPVSFGNGTWSYFSSTGEMPNFPPNYLNDNQITVEFKNVAYTEFYWTTTNDACGGIDIDTVRFVYSQNIGNSLPNLPSVINDCNTTFPDTVFLDSEISDPQIELTWGIFSFSGNAVPEIISTNTASTAIVFSEPGEYTIFLHTKSNSDCAGFIIESNFNYININLSESGSPAFAGEDQQVCDDFIQLSANTPDLGEGFWSIVSYQPADLKVEISNFMDPNATISLDKAGTVFLTWNITGTNPNCGISSFDEIEIIFIGFEIGTTSIQLCGEDKFILNHSSIQTGQLIFNQIEGPSLLEIRTITDESTLVENIAEGNYLIEYNYFVDGIDCSSVDTISLSNVMEPNSNFSFQNNLCVNDIVSEALYPIEFLPSGFNLASFTLIRDPSGNPVANAPIINQDTTAFMFDGFSEPGEYLFGFSMLRNGCLFEGNFVYIIDLPPSIDQINKDYLFCIGDVFQLNGFVSDELFYNWSPSDLVNDSSLADPIFVGDKDTTLLLTISNTDDFSNCLVETFIDIKLSDSITVDLTKQLDVCFPENIILEIDNNATYDVSWYLSNQLNNPISTEQILELSITQDTIIYYEVNSGADCTLLDSIIVSGSTIEASILDSMVICNVEDPVTLLLENANPDHNYTWKDPNGVIIGTGFSQDITNPISGVYTICVESNNGACQDTLVASLIYSELANPLDLNIPDSISLCVPDVITIETGLSNDYKIQWSFDDNFDNIFSSNSTLEFNATMSTVLYYQIIDAFDCSTIDSVIVNGMSIDSSLPTQVSICDEEELILELLNPMQENDFQWKDPNGIAIGNDSILIVTNPIVGSYSLCITTMDSLCQITLSTQVLIGGFSTLNPTNFPDTVNVCFPESLNFEAVVSNDYEIEWSLDPNFGLNVETGFSYQYLAENPTVIFYRLSDTINCEYIDSIIVMGSTLNESIVSETIICDTSTAILLNIENYNADHNYTWKDPAGNTIGNSEILEVNKPTSGTYTICISSADGICTDTLNTQIIASALIDKNILDLPNALNICFPDSVSIGIDPTLDLQMQWSFDPTFNDIVSMQNQISFIASKDSILYYRVLDSLGCQIDNNIIIFGDSLEGSIIPEHELCSVDDPLNLEVLNASDDNIYLWKDPTGQNLGEGIVVSINQVIEGRYMLCRTLNDGICADTLYTEVRFSPLANGIEATANPYVIFEGDQSELNLDINIDTTCLVEWTPSSTLNDASLPSPIATPITTTTYTASITKGECMSFDTVTIIVRDLCEIAEEVFVPNMFTPNGDGFNDIFKVDGYFDDFEMIIFNRWGQKVANLDIDNNQWNGMHQNEMLPVDVYGYDMTILHCDGEEEKRKGSITLVR